MTRSARAVMMSAVTAVGLAASSLAATWAGMDGRAAIGILAWAVGAASAVGVLAGFLLNALRARGVVTQVVVAALAPVAAVAAGVWGAAAAMFLSLHDLRVLIVVLIAAGTVGVVTALAFGGRVAAASASLGLLASRIGDEVRDRGEAGDAAPARRGGPVERMDVAAQLDAALERLAESRAQAAAIEESRRELVAWVSHDLRTPMAAIRAMVEALEDGLVEDPDTVARYYRTLRGEADRLAALVDDLFELSRIHAGALDLHLEPVALDELVSDAVAGVAIAAEAKGIGLCGEVRDPAPVVELSIPDMARVVRNLLDNAIRHTPPGGSVHIEASIDAGEGSAVVSVRDGCGGIPAPDLPRVFEMAYRGDVARGRADGGAGLGLAVARGLVEAHRGEISVVNEGEGCCFTVRLPVAAERA
jgi:signal transduction histidine kinase